SGGRKIAGMTMTYDVDIQRFGAMALFDLKGKTGALSDWAGNSLPPFPQTPNTASTADGADLLFIGHDHWLLVADLADEPGLDASLRPARAPSDISIVRISDTMCWFEITGRDADQIIALASPLDVHPAVFPENGATFTEAFGLKALILRRKAGLLLAVEQSFGDMIEDYLARATA
ncbi:MAG: hypothetical protein LJE68_16555, partial [Rhodobacter sp.]|nr:hypothetical protein [Rhodobacter sp.]